MIYNFIAYAPKGHQKDLGWTYNKYMEILPDDDDWACFLDHDAMFTTTDWFSQLEEIVAQNPQYALLSALTNRTGNTEQRVSNIDYNNQDICYHRRIGKIAQQQHRMAVVDVSNSRSISGVVILVKKAAWKKTGGFTPGFLGVDCDFSQRIVNSGQKVGIMTGIYVYHWYRFEDSDLKPFEIIEIKTTPRRFQRFIFLCLKNTSRFFTAIFKKQ